MSLLRLETSKSRIFRCFEVVDIQDPSQARQVLQCQYTVWPDHGAPHCPKEFLDFMDEVRSEAGRCNADEGPWLIHCSAGCGRTGTFCTLDVAMSSVDKAVAGGPMELVSKDWILENNV